MNVLCMNVCMCLHVQQALRRRLKSRFGEGGGSSNADEMELRRVRSLDLKSNPI